MDDLPEEEKPGIPAWVVTFADLMSLLMCFFVLLLSFSEIDAQKFKQIAGELSKAFGVQREVPALEIPQGTSPIFDKFSPAPPEPTSNLATLAAALATRFSSRSARERDAAAVGVGHPVTHTGAASRRARKAAPTPTKSFPSPG